MLINDASITGSLIVNASSSFQNIAVSGNILPGTNNVYNLGSADKYFKEIFVSTSSINFVDNGIVTASLNANTLNSLLQNTSSANVSIVNINSFTQSFSASVSTSFGLSAVSVTSLSSSVTTTITTLSSSVSTSFGLSAASVTSLSSSTSTSFSSSAASVTSLSSSISSSVTFLSSSLTSVNTTQNNRLSSIELVTGSYATTGSNTFFGTQTFSGSVFIANNLTVQGSSSIQYISASSVSIGTNIVQLNTANPAIRFAGLSIIDSGSVGGSGSFLYDSKEDEFLFVHRGNGINVTSSHFVMGPETFDNLGNEIYLTTNVLSKGTGKEHLVDSCIFDNGTTTCFYNSTTINSSGVLTSTNLVGTICARNGVVSGSSQVDGTAITNKSITIAGTSTALGGTITLATMTGGSAIHSGSYLATATTANLSENTNLYYTDARVKTKLDAETVISGSGQVAIASTSGFGTYINQALLTTSSPTFNTVTATFSGNITGNVTGNVSGTSNNITAYTINQSVGTSDSPSFNQVFSSNNGNGTNYRVGDDAWFGDVNVANTVRLKGVQDATAGYLTFGNQTTQLGLTNSTTLTWGAAFTATGDVTAYSDIRVKENIKTIDNALDKVLRLRGVTFNRIDLDDKSEKMGVIAQEIMKVVPQVIMEENDRLSVAYGNLAALFIEAIKEQQIKIDNLTIEVENLKKPKGL